MSRRSLPGLASVPALLVALLVALPPASPLAAQSVPTTINYQGRLLQNTSAQDAVAGTVDIVFSIWSGPATDGGAVELWSESWTGVALSNGIFSVLLGSNGSPLDPALFQANPSPYLQLEIDGEILLPRQQLGSAPFAMVDEPGNELQDLELVGDTLGLSGSPATVDLAPYLDNTDAQTLSLAGTTLSISGSGSAVSLAAFANTDSQNLANVLSHGNNASGQNLVNVGNITATGLNCPNCVQTADIAQDTIGGNDITDDIYILHIDCNGACNDISMTQACDVIENLRGLTFHVELIGVSCIHGVPSTPANGFVPCDAGSGPIGANECRAFNLRTLGDIPCIDGTGTDAIVTCLRTNIPR